MIFVKVILSFVCTAIVSLSWGQSTNQVHENEPSRNIISSKKVMKLSQIYFEETNKLKTYFIKGEIQNGFPGYNYALSKEMNANELNKWLAIGNNKSLLTKEGIAAIELYTKSK